MEDKNNTVDNSVVEKNFGVKEFLAVSLPNTGTIRYLMDRLQKFYKIIIQLYGIGTELSKKKKKE